MSGAAGSGSGLELGGLGKTASHGGNTAGEPGEGGVAVAFPR